MKKFVIAIVIIVAIVIIAGLFVVGSPNQERIRRFDDFRVQHLQQLQSELITFWQMKGRLPYTLEELVDSARGVVAPSDPQTGARYEYSKQDDLHFILCATFAADSKSADLRGPKYAPYAALPYLAGVDYHNQNWDHGVGRACFDRTIDPNFFKQPQIP